MFTYYESPEELIKDYQKHGSPRGTFYGEMTGQPLVDTILKGDERLVSDAEKFLEQIEAQVPDTLNKELMPYVYGPILSVPDYLTGVPTPFRRHQLVESTTAPIKLVVALTSSGGVSPRDLKTRGLAITALVMKLQAVRPVDIIVYSEMDAVNSKEYFNNNREVSGHSWTPSRGRSILAVKLESRPLSIAHAINMLSNSGIPRNLMYRLSVAKHGSSGNYWPEDWRTPAYDKWVREQFQAEENDIFVPATFLRDEIVHNPVGWINSNLSKLGYIAE